MPSIWVFTPKEIVDLMNSLGFYEVKMYGLPSFIYPTPEDTSPHLTRTPRYTEYLRNNFELIKGIEIKYLFEEDKAGRGNNILVISKRAGSSVRKSAKEDSLEVAGSNPARPAF